MQQTILQSTHNLKKVVCTNQEVVPRYYCLVRTFSQGPSRSRLQLNGAFFRYLKEQIVSMPESLKDESSNLLRVWMRQCECVFAQRIRRGQQMFSLYTRLWEEQALRQFIKNIRQQMSRHGKEFVFSAVGFTAYNWDTNRIRDEEILSHLPEMEYIKVLKDKTVMCQVCARDTEKLDKSVVVFCDCKGRKETLQMFENWSLFIEEPDLIVWRRLHGSGSFEYKVYGTYNDVTAEDFLSVQIDTTYRKQWDPTAVALEVVERDLTPDSNSDIIYWEMQWPRLFANRDYVFNRRFLVDRSKKLVMLLSKATQHASYPSKPNKYRVADYWSSMVIKPYTEIDKLGIEFSLTYYDNPGVNIPQAVTSWVAYRAMPDFLTRLRAATLKYKDYCHKNQCSSIFTYKNPVPPAGLRRPRTAGAGACEPVEEDTENLFDVLKNKLGEEEDAAKQCAPESRNTLDELADTEDAVKEISLERNVPAAATEAAQSSAVEKQMDISSLSSAEIILSPSPIMQADQSYWKYLHPMYYIS